MDKPSVFGTGEPPSAKTPASVRSANTPRDNGMSLTHGQERGQNLTPEKSQTEEEEDVDDNEREDYSSNGASLSGMDMIDRANSGRPVLSSTADLGLEEQVQDKKSERVESSTSKGKELGSTQSMPTPTSPIL